MTKGELALIEWITRQQGRAPAHVELSVGDDMAVLRPGGSRVLVTSDMLLDGVHFVVDEHGPERVGRKAIACSLSDCAAMAVRPVAAVASVALPADADMEFAQAMFAGMKRAAEPFNCPIVGGDTTSWASGLVVDVAMLGEPWPGCDPVRRSGARPNDALYVTGPLGGSLEGHHLDFTPRVHEARRLVTELGDGLHAMIDISDGLALDLKRMCDASGCGAEIYEALVSAAVSDAAQTAFARDGRPALDHALHDGEDFELLFALDPRAPEPPLGLPVGRMVESGLTIVAPSGEPRPVEPKGFQHFT